MAKSHPSYLAVASRLDRINKALGSGNLAAADLAALRTGYTYTYKDRYGNDALALGNPGAVDNSGAGFTEGEIGRYTIPFVVTTYDEDRDGDVVVPLGYRGSNYVSNPVWFFGHQQWEVPIGQARSEDGRILVWPEDKRVRQACRFDEHDEDSMFIYEKVRRGFLNATSIAFVPVEAYRRDDVRKAPTWEAAHTHSKPGGMPPGWVFEVWDHTETSIVGVPSNAGAIRDMMDRERPFITPKCYKALGYYAAETKGCWNGWCPAGTVAKNGRCVSAKYVKEHGHHEHPESKEHKGGPCGCSDHGSSSRSDRSEGLACPCDGKKKSKKVKKDTTTTGRPAAYVPDKLSSGDLKRLFNNLWSSQKVRVLHLAGLRSTQDRPDDWSDEERARVAQHIELHGIKSTKPTANEAGKRQVTKGYKWVIVSSNGTVVAVTSDKPTQRVPIGYRVYKVETDDRASAKAAAKEKFNRGEPNDPEYGKSNRQQVHKYWSTVDTVDTLRCGSCNRRLRNGENVWVEVDNDDEDGTPYCRDCTRQLFNVSPPNKKSNRRSVYKAVNFKPGDRVRTVEGDIYPAGQVGTISEVSTSDYNFNPDGTPEMACFVRFGSGGTGSGYWLRARYLRPVKSVYKAGTVLKSTITVNDLLRVYNQGLTALREYLEEAGLTPQRARSFVSARTGNFNDDISRLEAMGLNIDLSKGPAWVRNQREIDQSGRKSVYKAGTYTVDTVHKVVSKSIKSRDLNQAIRSGPPALQQLLQEHGLSPKRAAEIANRQATSGVVGLGQIEEDLEQHGIRVVKSTQASMETGADRRSPPFKPRLRRGPEAPITANAGDRSTVNKAKKFTAGERVRNNRSGENGIVVEAGEDESGPYVRVRYEDGTMMLEPPFILDKGWSTPDGTRRKSVHKAKSNRKVYTAR